MTIDLGLVASDDLIEEYFKRNDCVVLLSMKILSNQSYTIFKKFKGDRYVAQGMCERMVYKLNHEIDKCEEHIDSEDI
ncbi:MAG TPA: hypothetical protein V6D12_14135 [Candidatus Obscuribacterales bacterium]